MRNDVELEVNSYGSDASSSVTTAELDPYHEWLQITDPQRPVDPYRLLGLQPLERDFQKIHQAAEDCLKRLAVVRGSVDPRRWQAIQEEVAAAVALLENDDRKALLDARWMRRQARAKTAITPPATAAAITIHCPGCRRENPGNRRFCAQCGGSLWERCTHCADEISAEERFCGSCGTDVISAREVQQQRQRDQLAEGRRLGAELRYQSAIAELRGLALTEDPKAEPWAQQAGDLIEEYLRANQAALASAGRLFERAQKYFAAFSFENAYAQLEEIPPLFRTQEAETLRLRAQQARNEVLALGGEIRQAVERKETDGLLPKIERLLHLKPNYSHAQKLAEQLRDRLLLKARGELTKNDYRAALDTLSGISAFISNEDAKTLGDTAEELNTLLTSIRTAAFADEPTIALARRFAKVAPSHPDAAALAAKLEHKAKQKPPSPRSALVDWAPVPKKSRLNLPIEPLAKFLRLAAKEGETAAELNSGRYFAAFGLALQGLERSATTVNLLPEQKATVLSTFSSAFRKKAVKSAWGLDLSPSGLKAVRLTADEKTGAIVATAAEYFPHGKALHHPEAEVDRHEIVQTTLKRFLGTYKVDGERIVSSLSGRVILGRFFEVPPMAAKKVDDAVAFEAKHQVPIPLDELVWDYQVQGSAEAQAADDQPRRIVLTAVREYHAKERLKQFKDAGIALHALAPEATALHNAIHYECCEEAAFKPPREGTILTLDIGADGANCVISGPNFCWFRSLSLAGNDFTQALIKQFKLTYDQAEQLKLEPAKARRLSHWLTTLQPLFLQTVSEIERTLASHAKVDGAERVGSVFGLGGGFQTFGLCRELRGGG